MASTKINTKEKINQIIGALNSGDHQGAIERCFLLHEDLKLTTTLSDVDCRAMLQMAGILIDVGGDLNDLMLVKFGVSILEDNEVSLLAVHNPDVYFYYLGNGRMILLNGVNPFEMDFYAVEDYIDVKTIYWRMMKAHSSEEQPEYLVNFANVLSAQFRVAEAMAYYKKAISLDGGLGPAWASQSRTLLMLNTITNEVSNFMLMKIYDGFINAASDRRLLGDVRLSFHATAEKIKNKMIGGGVNFSEFDFHADAAETRDEFNSLSSYRKFCLANDLCLSLHGLYCPCIASAVDNLSIIPIDGIHGDSIIPMELVLNRLKSEFSLARLMYYECVSLPRSVDLLEESHFSNLNNSEVLGVEIEKARTAFRLCFGILDKIGQSICDLFDLHPKNNIVYFQNFWQLDVDNRREKFEKIRNPGLLALYSIATDLNEKKYGELAFYKDLRNHFEHQFVIIHYGENPPDEYSSFSYKKRKALLVREDEFLKDLERMLKITRSAIFSFVFMVRNYAASKDPVGDYAVQKTIFPVK